LKRIYDISLDYSNYHVDDEDGYYRGDLQTEPFGVVELSQKLPHIVVPETFDFDVCNIDRLVAASIAKVNSGTTVFTNELINVLNGVSKVDWTLFPVRFFNPASGEEVLSGRFSAVFFDEFGDYFDYENSDYDDIDWSLAPPDKVTERMRKNVSVVRKMVLKEPDGGFPPCFRLLASSTGLYISESAHTAILEAGLTGLNLFPYDV